ncbi:MAG: fibronectin type III domain-containing protein, partial [Anaerolineales bacterium]|nr:fibronectin type III domain-containing protein [Anaerolineales bacterium]
WATRVQRNNVTLSWIDNSTNETRFEVYRSTDGTAFVLIGTTGVDRSTYTDRTVNRNTRYWYYVTACNAAGCSQASETIDVRTRR